VLYNRKKVKEIKASKEALRLEVSLLTMQLLVQVASRRNRKRPDELFKLDGAVLGTRATQEQLTAFVRQA
jgi:hypothetical protein